MSLGLVLRAVRLTGRATSERRGAPLPRPAPFPAGALPLFRHRSTALSSAGGAGEVLVRAAPGAQREPLRRQVPPAVAAEAWHQPSPAPCAYPEGVLGLWGSPTRSLEGSNRRMGPAGIVGCAWATSCGANHAALLPFAFHYAGTLSSVRELQRQCMDQPVQAQSPAAAQAAYGRPTCLA